jgi:hypothetical protein
VSEYRPLVSNEKFLTFSSLALTQRRRHSHEKQKTRRKLHFPASVFCHLRKTLKLYGGPVGADRERDKELSVGQQKLSSAGDCRTTKFSFLMQPSAKSGTTPISNAKSYEVAGFLQSEPFFSL